MCLSAFSGGYFSKDAALAWCSYCWRWVSRRLRNSCRGRLSPRAGVFLPFLFRGFTESLNAVKLVRVHHWPWFGLWSASCWSTDLTSSSFWTFPQSSSIQEVPQPNLILWDLAAASEVMSPEALSWRWSTFWVFFSCHWSLQRSSVFPQKQKDLSCLVWSTMVWTLSQVLG